ncbi:16S rRNA (guanine(527)-N(7))-methyltransferase RsmG [Paracoccus sp. R86501]|uniref:16S rRNA (guanine(527)-N(7))-methyltransferase RsmG n=1 Tax=Paracoccus sp. R86501 TaxID=3101711 RepID=UPI00366C6F6A
MINVSRETGELFDAYKALLSAWNPKINLVAASTLVDFRHRHVEDCLQLAEHLPSAIKGHWVDFGSGGGLPGLVMAIFYRDMPIRFTLVESDKRKCQFLKTVVRELSLTKVQVVSDRIEKIEPFNADYASARALAALNQLLKFVHLHLSTDGTALLMKGRSWKDEVEVARNEWQFDLEHFNSTTDPEAAILKISGVSHA